MDGSDLLLTLSGIVVNDFFRPARELLVPQRSKMWDTPRPI